MKRKMLTVLLAMTMAAALTGCGKEKVPTIEEIRDNLSDSRSTTYEGEISLTCDADLKVSNLSDDLEMYAGMLKDELGIDLSQKQTLGAEITATMSGERDDSYEHDIIEGKASIDSNIDMLMEYMPDTSEELNRENYIDFDEEIKYYTTDDGDNWYYEDYESDDDSDPTKILDLFISVNEYAGEEDVISVVPTEDGRYYLAFDGVVDQDFIENLSDDDIDALEEIFDDVDADLDLDELKDFYEEYGDYVTVEMPVAIELYYVNIGDKKNAEYVLDEAALSIGANVSIDWDKSEVEALLDEAGAPANVDLTCEVKANFGFGISMSMTFGYDEVEVSIPSKVEDNAVEYDEYDIDEIDWGDVDYSTPDIDDDNTNTSSANITTIDPATGKELHRLENYDGLEIFNFAIPEGWEYDASSSSKTYHTIDGDQAFITVRCTAPSGICAYYESDPEDYMLDDKDDYEYVGSYTTDGNPYGYDIYVDEFDYYYAVFYAEEYTSLIIEYYQFSSAEGDSLENFENILSEAF